MPNSETTLAKQLGKRNAVSYGMMLKGKPGRVYVCRATARINNQPQTYYWVSLMSQKTDNQLDAACRSVFTSVRDDIKSSVSARAQISDFFAKVTRFEEDGKRLLKLEAIELKACGTSIKKQGKIKKLYNDAKQTSMYLRKMSVTVKGVLGDEVLNTATALTRGQLAEVLKDINDARFLIKERRTVAAGLDQVNSLQLTPESNLDQVAATIPTDEIAIVEEPAPDSAAAMFGELDVWDIDEVSRELFSEDGKEDDFFDEKEMDLLVDDNRNTISQVALEFTSLLKATNDYGNNALASRSESLFTMQLLERNLAAFLKSTKFTWERLKTFEEDMKNDGLKEANPQLFQETRRAPEVYEYFKQMCRTRKPAPTVADVIVFNEYYQLKKRLDFYQKCHLNNQLTDSNNRNGTDLHEQIRGMEPFDPAERRLERPENARRASRISSAAGIEPQADADPRLQDYFARAKFFADSKVAHGKGDIIPIQDSKLYKAFTDAGAPFVGGPSGTVEVLMMIMEYDNQKKPSQLPAQELERRERILALEFGRLVMLGSHSHAECLMVAQERGYFKGVDVIYSRKDGYNKDADYNKILSQYKDRLAELGLLEKRKKAEDEKK